MTGTSLTSFRAGSFGAKARRLLWAVCVGLALTPAALAQSVKEPAVVLAQRDSTFRIVLAWTHPAHGPQELSIGSGFAITANLVMTNAHVVESAREASTAEAVTDFNLIVQDQTGHKYPVLRETVFKKVDLAVLEIPGTRLKPVTFHEALPGTDEEIWAMGYPGSMIMGDIIGLAQLSKGTVQGTGQMTSGKYPVTTYIRHSADIGPGSSGGPLFNACGQLVGVNTRGSTTQVGPGVHIPLAGAANAAVSSQDVLGFLSVEMPKVKVAQAALCDLSSGGPSIHVLWLTPLALALLGAGGWFWYRKRRAGGRLPTADTPGGRTGDKTTPTPPVQQYLTLRGAITGKPFELKARLDPAQPFLTIGRAAGNDFVIDLESISRKHARIEVNEHALVLSDLGSMNGTSVNGARLEPNETRTIPNGARLRLGTIDLEVHLS